MNITHAEGEYCRATNVRRTNVALQRMPATNASLVNTKLSG